MRLKAGSVLVWGRHDSYSPINSQVSPNADWYEMQGKSFLCLPLTKSPEAFVVLERRNESGPKLAFLILLHFEFFWMEKGKILLRLSSCFSLRVCAMLIT